MRLLLVDDDDFLREALAEALAYEGHEIASASDGAQALALLERGLAPDAVLLDLMMPVLDGWGFVERQQSEARWADIPVIVLTAIGTLPRPIEARTVLHKPFRIETLLEALRGTVPAQASAHL
jgi:CheY-like chemotaxis protein